MKWLKSTTGKAWTVNGRTIPADKGENSQYLELEDSEYTAISQKPVIASLIRNGEIMVSSVEPAEIKYSLPALQTSNANLQQEIASLKAQLAQAEADKEQAVNEVRAQAETDKEQAVNEIKAQAVQELKDLQDELNAVRKELATTKKKVKESE